MPPRLFTYGSLMPGRAYAHLLDPAPGEWEVASVNGFIDQNGWGHSTGFPAVILSEAGASIPGMLLTSERLPLLWPQLDDYEGDAYQRIRTRVMRSDGSYVDAFVYTLHADLQQDTYYR